MQIRIQDDILKIISNQTVSLIVPIYNESHHLEEVLRMIDDVELPCMKEIILIDDCSTDGSQSPAKCPF